MSHAEHGAPPSELVDKTLAWTSSIWSFLFIPAILFMCAIPQVNEYTAESHVHAHTSGGDGHH